MTQEGHTRLLPIMILDETIRLSRLRQGILMNIAEGVTILERNPLFLPHQLQRQ